MKDLFLLISNQRYEVFTQTNASAALAASIFHYNECTVEGVKQYLKDRGVAIR